MDLQTKILQLKKEKNALILAHYYQDPQIQEIADHIGDSLGLSQRAYETDAEIILFAGVHFMAETAKILNPNKKVLLPDLAAGCSLADSCPPGPFREFLDAHPDHVVVTYINCSAQIKAMSDYVCTSSNAVKIIESIPRERPIIFAPDKNLGRYLIQKTGRDLLLWDGSCIVHEAFSMDKLIKLHREHPKAIIMAHPESEDHILRVAHFVGSTAGMIAHAEKHPQATFLVGTEAGILHQMQKKVPQARLIPLPIHQDNSCGCSECAYMKLNTMEKLYDCLYWERPQIELPQDLIDKALLPIERMLELS